MQKERIIARKRAKEIHIRMTRMGSQRTPEESKRRNGKDGRREKISHI